ncbi:MAG: hypothetical protein QM817_05115 [Archangium sp.]
MKHVVLVSLLLLAGCPPTIDLEAQCHDGRLNGPETDVDCGGACGPCVAQQLCLVRTDCESRNCAANRCEPSSCTDGLLNQDEVSVDCGGSCPPCTGGNCTDGIVNGNETGVDCGGRCSGCPPGAPCLLTSDCQFDQCMDGACGGTCAAPLTQCGNRCVNLLTDRFNCGACNRSCPDGCMQGNCVFACGGGSVQCPPGICTDIGADPFNCGMCGRMCDLGEVCAGGVCAARCAPTQQVCNGACVSLDRDAQNCGMCGRACAPGSGCVSGQCTASCSSPLRVCGSGTCVDPRFDPLNCGGCNMPCPPQQNAQAACTPMGCTRGPCQPGFADCDGMPNGCEAELGNDSFNCGACGRQCFAGETCALGRCCGMPPMGSYQSTCQNCEACNGVLQCLCEDGVQVLHPTSFPLGTCVGDITNCNGVLQCAGC